MRERADASALGALASAVVAVAAWRLRSTLAQRTAGRLRAAVHAERRWNRSLTDELHDLHRRRAPLEGGEDARDLVLRTAMNLLGAKKGLLLSRSDVDGDGDLDLVCAHGFERDPEHDAVAQRFARVVLERDETVREDDPPHGSELHCLVAIPMYLFDRFQGVVVCGNRPGGFSELDEDVLVALGDHAGAALHSQHVRREMRDVHRGALRQLVGLVDAADPRLGAAAAEAATLAAALARRLHLEPPQRDVTVAAAALADLGMIAMPSAAVQRAGPLTREERAAIQRHPMIGFDILGQVPGLRDIGFGVLYHHERHDGDGYPTGLAGDGIPPAARIVAVVTTYCALTRDRAYSDALTPSEAARELVEGAGTQFHPDVVVALLDELEHPQLRGIDGGLGEAVVSWLMLPERSVPRVLDLAEARLTDSVTLLGGHRVLHEAAAALAAEPGPFAVLAVRLPGLPAVNEREGYAAGDALLAGAARKLRRAAARAGATAYRDGGNRLIVLAPGVDETAARRLADDVAAEFGLGPEVAVACAVRHDGQDGSAVLAAARASLEAMAAPLATGPAHPRFE
jgi:GGDEF domain-containing protein